MITKQETDLLEYVTWILAGNKPELIKVGLCDNFEDKYDCCSLALTGTLAESWKHYSGDKGYPISTTLDSSPHDQFWTTLNLWDRRTLYGQRRYQFCEHIRDTLREKL